MSRRQHGFSLLELLVVLFVVVIITSLVTLTVNTGTRDRVLDTEVRNLADVAAYAIDEAQPLLTSTGMAWQASIELLDGSVLWINDVGRSWLE